MAPEDLLSSLSNPLATSNQLLNSSSQLDGISSDLEDSLRYAGARITQAAGILLRLPQEIIAQAIVTFTRFFVGPEGGSFRMYAIEDISPACIYLTAKVSSHPQTTRSICNVYAYLLSPTSPSYKSPNPLSESTPKIDPESYYLSEATYLTIRSTLLATESIVLRTLCFVTRVSLPHHLALTYLQTTGVLPSKPTPSSKALAQRTLAHLNTALLSPQLLYLAHQPPALAVAALYLAARETGVKLPGMEWWEVFDVDREELGFLVVAFGSCEGWVRREAEMWEGTRCPVTIEELEAELRRRAEETSD